MAWLVRAGGVLGRRWGRLLRKPPDRDLLVVRKGMSLAYYFFCKMFAQERGLAMVLDRRRQSRRRRQRPPLRSIGGTRTVAGWNPSWIKMTSAW